VTIRQHWRNIGIASLSLAAIATHLVLRYVFHRGSLVNDAPLWIAMAVGGIPLVIELAIKLVHFRFGSDLLAGISIITAAVLGEYLAGTIIVLMLSGGAALEGYAIQSASSVLRALAKRMPATAHRKTVAGVIDIPLEQITVGEILSVFPHDVCPVDGVVVDGNGNMDESFLTGEPFRMSKAPGSEVISGAINGETVLNIRATRAPEDSRYAKIMKVMHESELNRPR
jgi:cation transport ATPase